MTRPTVPLYGSIVIMGLIIAGFIAYFVIEYFIQKRKVAQDKKVSVTHLSDFELRPIDQQDLAYEDAVSLFNSHRSVATNANNVSVVSSNMMIFGQQAQKDLTKQRNTS